MPPDRNKLAESPRPVSHRLHTHMSSSTSDTLLVIYRFFDTPVLRHFYTGLLADIRGVLAERGVDVLDDMSDRSDHEKGISK